MKRSEQTPGESRPCRLLIPINASADSRWGVQYAVRRHRAGKALEVVLLNIGDPVSEWQALRFRTQQEVAQFQAERAQTCIDEAAHALERESIPWRGLFKQGELVFLILDVAEELDCHEIVMSAPKKGVAGIFSGGVVAAVQQQQRDIPVVVVSREGVPV